MTFLRAEIIRLLMTRTTVVASPIPMPFTAEVVTASVGHMPSISTKVGFSVMIPFFHLSTIGFISNALL